MSEFKTIETQEELDRIVKERLARQKEKYADYDKLRERVEELETENAELHSTVESSKSEKGKFDKQIADLQARFPVMKRRK